MRIGIIGAGAAGLMAASTIHEQSPSTEVFLIDRNRELGKKVSISGGGRCNVTTGLSEIKEILKRYPRGATFLVSAMRRFPPQLIYDWFEAHGIPLKTEKDLRVFPISDRGTDVVDVFYRMFTESNVHMLLEQHVTSVQKQNNKFEIVFKNHPSVVVDKLMLATGGQAYRHTGSTGDGYAFAQTFGHTLTQLAPSLNAFFTQETWPKLISGLSFQEATIRTINLKTNQTFTGPFLFTHQGISGPAVFALSSLIAFETYDKNRPLKITIDLFPNTSTDTLMKHLQDLINTHPKKSMENILAMLVPKSMAEIGFDFVFKSENQSRETGFKPVCTDEGTKSRDIHAIEYSKTQKQSIVHWLKNIPLTVITRGGGDEFVTAGGINTDEVNQNTMESLLCPNLYFGGEILNIDGFTGGFNLQASWATGFAAGEAMSKER